MLRKITIGILVCVVAATVQATDYCSLNSCHKPHIACNNDWRFGPKCPDNPKLINLSPYIRDILDFHNVRRNKIAGGGEDGFLPAERMATMQWDNELAAIASYTAKTCFLSNEGCTNTETFHNSGSYPMLNSYVGEVSAVEDKKIIDFMLLDLYSRDIKLSNMNNINNFKQGSPGGYFTVMVIDNNIRIGCAASRYSMSPGWYYVLLNCIYASNNRIGKPIYVSGKTASKCQTGTNPKYPNLCSVNEVYTDL